MRKLKRENSINWNLIEQRMFNNDSSTSTSFEDMMYDNKDTIPSQR